MRHMGVVAAFWLTAASFAGEDVNLIDKARKDVPDAVLDRRPGQIEKLTPGNAELLHRKMMDELQRSVNRRGPFTIDTKGPKEDAEAREKIKAALERKLTFEFAETSLDEALVFLKMLTGVEIAFDASVLAAERQKSTINLKAVDLQLEAALSRIARQAECKWEIRGTAIVLFVPNADRAANAEEKEKPRGERNAMPKLHAKLPDGTEIEADAPLLMMPGIGQIIADRIFDPAKDGILVFNLVRDFEPGFSVEKLKEAIAKVAPHVSIELVWIGNGLIVATSDSVGELRKAQTLIRALKPQMGPPPGGDRMRRAGPPRPEEMQQPQPPKKDRREEAPGQF
jgi:hypothetical protein